MVNKIGQQPTIRRLLTGADLQPTEMPPAAVLIVRRLSDPLPGQMTSHRHPVRVRPIWERAVRASLAAIYRNAASPSQTSVADSAPAVRFTDEGEMLACLTFDMARGQATSRWWWQTILRKLPSPSASGLPSLFVAHAVSVPAALYYLAERNLASEVLSTLSAPQAMIVLAAVGEAFGNYTLAARLPGASAGDEGRSQRYLPPNHGYNSRIAGQNWEQTPPWPAHRSSSALGREQACLLGVALTLYTRPALVRSESFLRQLHAWWGQAEPAAAASDDRKASWPLDQYMSFIVEKGQTQRPPADDSAATSPNTPVKPLPGQGENIGSQQIILPVGEEKTEPVGEGKTEDEVSQASEASSEQSDNSVSDSGLYATQATAPGHDRWQVDELVRPDYSPADADEPTGTMLEGRVSHPQPPAFQQQNRFVAPSTAPAINPERRSIGDTDELRLAPVQPEQATPTPAEPLTDGAAVGNLSVWPLRGLPTELGGVLYLINLMGQLDLPDCCEADWGLASVMGAWGVLEALARGLLATTDEADPDDPLWAALAQLDGRTPDQLPGAALADSPGFRIPAGWLLPTAAPEACFWSQQNGRLRLWSDHGYLLLDWPYKGPVTEEQIKHDLPGLGEHFTLHAAVFNQAPVAPIIGPLVDELNPHLRRWLTWVLPYVRWRLRHMLHPSTPDATELANDFLFCASNLYVTATHVDLLMRLDDISIPLRLTGLDRNPGWLADFSRVILFHFV